MLPGVIGLVQATETVKLLLGKGQSLVGRLLVYDALKMTFREYAQRRDPRCALCGEHPTITGPAGAGAGAVAAAATTAAPVCGLGS